MLPNLDPPGLPRVLPVQNPRCLIYIQDNSFANNTYLKITLDKKEPAMFAVWFTGHFLQRSCGIIETWNLPEKILLFKALKDSISRCYALTNWWWSCCIWACMYKKAESWFVIHFAWHVWFLTLRLLPGFWFTPFGNVQRIVTACWVLDHRDIPSDFPPVHHPVEFLAVMCSQHQRQASLASAAAALSEVRLWKERG